MDLPTQLSAALQAQDLPVPTITWLRALIGARNPPPQLRVLLATARARLLAADLTTPSLIDPSAASFPPTISDPQVRETKLTRDIHVQILQIEDLTQSRWSQVEQLESIDRGELTKGREVIRLPTGGEDGETVADGSGSGGVDATRSRTLRTAGVTSGMNATHKLLLQDYKGTTVAAIELKRVLKLGLGSTNMGEKMVVKKGTVVARGTILLEPSNVLLLGGKVDEWHKAWLAGRLQTLKEAVGAGDRTAGPR